MPTEIAPKEIQREGLRTLLRRGGQLLDVRPRAEFEQAHLVDAVSVPLGHFDRTLANKLKWDKPVIVYSSDAQDDLSARAAWMLAALGFTQVFRYTLGLADWLANGLPAEGPQAQAEGAGDLADMEVPTCTRGEKMAAVAARVREAGWNACVVVNAEEIVLGLLPANALEKASPTWSAEEAMERTLQTYRLNAPLAEVRAYFKANPWVEGAVVTTTDGKLFGLIRRADVG